MSKLPKLSFFLILFLSLISSIKAKSPNLQELFIKSAGGPDALTFLKEYSGYASIGTIVMNNMQGTFKIEFQQPDHFLMSLQFDGMKLVQGFDGKIAWSTGMNGQTTVLEGMEKKELLKSLYFETQAYLTNNALPGSYGFSQDTTVNNTDYFIVTFYPYGIDTVDIWFDKESGLKEFQYSHMDAFEVVTTYNDYKQVGKLLLPQTTQATMAIANTSITTKTDTTIFNPVFTPGHFTMPGSQPKDIHFPYEKSSVTIPIDYYAGHIRLHISINGKKYTVILDSGASSNIFNISTMDEHQFTAIGSLPAMGVSGFDQITLYKTDSINIGDLTLYGLVAGAMDLTPVFPGYTTEDNFGGILGYDFLARFPIQIDYQSETLTLFNPDNFTPDSGGIAIDFYQTMLIPTISGEINGIKGDFIIDLGNAFGVILHPDFVQSNNLLMTLADVKENRVAIGGVGGQLPGKNGLAESFRMSGVELNDIRVIIPDSSPGMTGMKQLAGNIGNLVLSQFNILMDYKNNQIIFYPAEL